MEAIKLLNWIHLTDHTLRETKINSEFRTGGRHRIRQIISSGQVSEGKAGTKAWIIVSFNPKSLRYFLLFNFKIFSLSVFLLSANTCKTHWAKHCMPLY